MPFVVEVLKLKDKQVYTWTTPALADANVDETWVNALTANDVVKLVKPTLVIVKAQITAQIFGEAGVWQNSCTRIAFVNSAGARYHVGGYGWRLSGVNTTTTFEFQGFAVLPPETYDLLVDISEYYYDYVQNSGVNNIYIGTAELTDLWQTNSWSQSVYAAVGTRTEFGETTIPPLARNTIIGPLKKAMLFVFCGVDANIRYGDGAASNYDGFQIAVDGVWIQTPARKMTSQVENTAAFHWAQHWVLVDAAKSHTVKFRLSNGASSAAYFFHCGVMACPWLIPQDSYYDLIDIEVPVGSTVYGALEDFWMPAQKKYAAIRSENVINGVQTVAEWMQDPGAAAPLNFSYTPEWFETNIKLATKGTWNCLSRLAADLRG